MSNKRCSAVLFIACFLAVLLFSTSSFAKPSSGFELAIGMEADKNNHNLIRISISAYSIDSFKKGTVLLKVPAIGANPEYTTVLWSNDWDSPSSYYMKFENITFDLPKGTYHFATEFKAILSHEIKESGKLRNLYVDVGDNDTLWSTVSFKNIEVDKLKIEARKRGFEVNTIRDTENLPEDLKRRFLELKHRK